MCSYCNIPLYIKVQQLLRPVLAPLTRADALMDEYINLTGYAYVPLEKSFCPVCGRQIQEHPRQEQFKETGQVEQRSAPKNRDIISCETCRLYNECHGQKADVLDCCLDWKRAGEEAQQ